MDPVSAVRLPEALTTEVDRWAQEHEISRSEAIRRLVEIGLAKFPPAKRRRVLSTANQGAASAAEVAAKTIDKRLDPATSEEQRKVRKRKLVKGAGIVRDSRKDLPT